MRTLTNIESDEIELGASYAKSTAQSTTPSTELPRVHNGSANPFTYSVTRPSQDSDERALTDLTGRWKGLNNMEVQVDTTIEIQRDAWDGAKMEAGKSETVIGGPDAHVGRRQ